MIQSGIHKKHIRFVMDCSASMYRFNGWDERLNRSLEATALIMESFDGMDSQFDYSIVGHSGDSDCIRFVEFGNPPRNDKERMRILQSMAAHTQYCSSGDNTLESLHRAMVDVGNHVKTGNASTEEGFVICISDANLYRYGIPPKRLGDIIRGRRIPDSMNLPMAYCIFIASFGDEAREIQHELPVGR